MPKAANSPNEGGEIHQQQKVLLSRKDLKALGITVSNSTLIRWEDDHKFPLRLRLCGTKVAWLKCEIDDWLKDQEQRRKNYVYADF